MDPYHACQKWLTTRAWPLLIITLSSVLHHCIIASLQHMRAIKHHACLLTLQENQSESRHNLHNPCSTRNQLAAGQHQVACQQNLSDTSGSTVRSCDSLVGQSKSVTNENAISCSDGTSEGPPPCVAVTPHPGSSSSIGGLAQASHNAASNSESPVMNKGAGTHNVRDA